MFNKVIAWAGFGRGKPGHETRTARLDHVKAAYEEWRISQDIGAIMAAFNRLSDRRLAMIGLKRDELYEAVTEMMERVQEDRRIADEVMALLDKTPVTGERPKLPAPENDPVPETAANDARTAA